MVKEALDADFVDGYVTGPATSPNGLKRHTCGRHHSSRVVPGNTLVSLLCPRHVAVCTLHVERAHGVAVHVVQPCGGDHIPRCTCVGQIESIICKAVAGLSVHVVIAHGRSVRAGTSRGSASNVACPGVAGGASAPPSAMPVDFGMNVVVLESKGFRKRCCGRWPRRHS